MSPWLQLWLAVFPFLVAPVCAVGAGLATWVLTRGRRPEDGELLRHFLVVLGLLVLLSLVVVRTDAVQEKLDPGIRYKRELLATPLPAAMREHRPADWREIEAAVDAALAAGAQPAQVSAVLWPRLITETRQAVAFSAPPAPRAYAQGLLAGMQELQPLEPALCVRLAWPRAQGGAFDPTAKLSAQALQAYETGLVALLRHNSTSVQATPQTRSGWGLVRPEELQSAYAGIREAMAARHGDAVPKLHTAEISALEPARACSASMELLRRALALPAPLGDRILVELLRG